MLEDIVPFIVRESEPIKPRQASGSYLIMGIINLVSKKSDN